MTSVSLVDWKIEPRRLSVAAQLHRVRDIAVMGDREAARGELGEQGLDVAKRGLAGGRIADMADRGAAGEAADDVVAVEIAGDMAQRAVGMEIAAVPAGDSGRFLAAMLERVKAERDEAAALSAPQMPNTPHSSRSLSSSKGLVVSMLAIRRSPACPDAHIGSGRALSPRRLNLMWIWHGLACRGWSLRTAMRNLLLVLLLLAGCGRDDSRRQPAARRRRRGRRSEPAAAADAWLYRPLRRRHRLRRPAVHHRAVTATPASGWSSGAAT